jgi:hypothetical protein
MVTTTITIPQSSRSSCDARRRGPRLDAFLLDATIVISILHFDKFVTTFAFWKSNHSTADFEMDRYVKVIPLFTKSVSDQI